MAKVPLLSPGIAPYDAPAYTPNVICAAPGCDQPTQDPHHLWRRSFLAGAYDWVQIPEYDLVVGNVIGLCRFHHDQIEGGSAWITLERDPLEFTWTTLLSPAQELVWQPPVRVFAETTEEVDPETNETTKVDWFYGAPSTEPPDNPENRDEFELTQKEADELVAKGEAEFLSDPTICPSCKRPLPHSKVDGPPQERRPRRTWSVTVPKDERENGADVLDELLSASREQMARLGLPYGEDNSVKYFVLAASLALFVQHADQLMGDS